jgi:tetratricopeptide (TPR) repeat protein
LERIFGYLIPIVLVALALHAIYFTGLPLILRRACGDRKPEWLRRYLECVAATPSLLGGDAMKMPARSMLVGIYLPRGEHQRAAAHCRALLASMNGLPKKSRASLEADTRRRLADCLEALGQVDEAAQERQRAGECMRRTPADALGHQTKGTLLEREHRYAEAFEEHRKALELTPLGSREARTQCMLHLMLSSFNAGRPADCLHWAEQAIAAGATGRLLRSAHRMAGIACGS